MSENNEKRILPSQLRQGMKLADGAVIKKKYYFSNEKDYVIFLNQDKEVKYKINKVVKLIDGTALVSGELYSIINLFRKDLNLQMATIYKLLIEDDVQIATKGLETLKKEISSRKKMLKQFTYLGAPVIFSLMVYVIFSILNLVNVSFELKILEVLCFNKKLIIFSGIGNFLSISKNLKKIEFDSSETPISYFVFAFFKFLNSSVCSVMMIILYKSNLINITFEGKEKGLFLIILAVLGGFSESLIPNIFENLAKQYQPKGETPANTDES